MKFGNNDGRPIQVLSIKDVRMVGTVWNYMRQVLRRAVAIQS